MQEPTKENIMATKFVKATNKKTGFSPLMHDTDSPLELFKEVAELNAQSGETMKDWKFTLHNYKGDEIGKYDWKKVRVTVTLGDLFS
jgi:hypothetical protein